MQPINLFSIQEALASMLLQRILGMGAQIKRGSGQGKLAKAAAAASASNHSVGGKYCNIGRIFTTKELAL